MAADLPITPTPFDPGYETFKQRFFRRSGDVGYDLALRKIIAAGDRAEEADYMRGQHGVHFDPRQDIPIEDQREMSVGELELQHAYNKARGAYDRTPFDPVAPEPPVNPMAASMGAALIPWRPGEYIPDREKTETPNPAKPPLPRPRPKTGA